MTSVAILKAWFEQGKADPDCTHMIVKWDSFDNEDYPVYVHSSENVREVDAKNTERTVEVYSMTMPWETQAAQYRAFNYTDTI